MSFFDRFNWPPLIPFASKDLDLNRLQAGLFDTFYYVGYILTLIPAGIIADRYGSRIIIGSNLALMGTLTFTTGLINNAAEGYILRFFTGLTAGCIFAPSIRSILLWTPRKRIGSAVGFFLTGNYFAIMCIGLIIPPLATLYGWAWGFYVTGLSSILTGILILILLREPPMEPNSLTVTIKNYSAWRRILMNKDLWICYVGGFCIISVIRGTDFWAYDYLVTGRGIPTNTAGLLLSTHAIVTLVPRPIIGFISDIVGGRKKIITGSLLLLTALLVVFGFISDLLSLWIVLCFIGFNTVSIVILSIFILEITGENYMGSTYGLANTIWQIGSIISPALFGSLIDLTNSYLYGWISLALFSMIGAVFLFFIKERKQILA